MNEFQQLREANNKRQKLWDADNQMTIAYRSNELAGETSEVIEAVSDYLIELGKSMRVTNSLKKVERERLGIKGSRVSLEQVKDELGDVVICVDLVAGMLDIDLWPAVAGKFNKTSDAVGFDVKLPVHKTVSNPDEGTHGEILSALSEC